MTTILEDSWEDHVASQQRQHDLKGVVDHWVQSVGNGFVDQVLTEAAAYHRGAKKIGPGHPVTIIVRFPTGKTAQVFVTSDDNTYPVKTTTPLPPLKSDDLDFDGPYSFIYPLGHVIF